MNATASAIAALLVSLGACSAMAQDEADIAELGGPPHFVSPADAAEAMETLGDGRWSALDARSLGAYLAGHAPGAVHLSDAALRGARGGSPVRLIERERLAETFGAAGVRHGAPVFVFGERDDPLGATLIAYGLARVGHDDVRVIAGGYESWAANHAETRTLPVVAPASLEVREAVLDEAEYADFEGDIGYDGVVFVDARPREQYLGERATWVRNGHIPGAVSVPWKSLTAPGNPARLQDAASLREIMTDAGVSAADEVVVYCGTGREATMLMLALTGELGWDNVRLYEGSWTEYSSIESARVEVGERVAPLTRLYRDGRFRISAQPDKRTFDRAIDEGVTMVISCRSEREMDRLDFDQAAFLDAQGIEYVHVPMGGEHGYESEQVARFAEAIAEVMASSEGDVLVHCASGGRARYLWMAYLVTREGLTPSEAWARGESVGGRPWSFESLIGEPVMR
ncbi:MAG: rhodanese-like domain-containing protein [Planctomycetota bacterium]